MISLSRFSTDLVLNFLLTKNPTANPRELYDKVKMEYVSKMSKDELTLFTSALNKHSSTESTIRRLRFKKCDIIGRMPTNQSEFDPDRLSSYDDQSKMIWGDECNPEGGRTIVMTTLFLLQYISSVTQISVDGTFLLQQQH